MRNLRNISRQRSAGHTTLDSTPAGTPPSRKRAVADLLFHSPKQRRILWWLAACGLAAVAAIAAFFAFSDFEFSAVLHLVDWNRVTAAVERLDPGMLISAMAILPVFGFPVSVVYLMAGARFGPLWGGVVVTGATAVHLLASYGIARSVFRRPLLRFIARKHRHLPSIPEDEQMMVALVVALLPGVPYVVRLYLLALADIRLRYYFWISLVVFVLRSYVTILLGDLSSEPSGRRLLVLLGVDATKIVVCALVIWWLRVHHRRYHPAGDGLEPATGAAK